MMTIQDIIQRIDQNKTELGITLYSPATKLEMDMFEEISKIQLPNDIREFYKFCNGFESDEDWFRIIPLDEILHKKTDIQPDQFFIAEYMVYCDTWAVEVKPLHNTYLIKEHSFKTVLTNSFIEFLEHFLTGGVFEKGGLYDWKEEISKRTD